MFKKTFNQQVQSLLEMGLHPSRIKLERTTICLLSGQFDRHLKRLLKEDRYSEDLEVLLMEFLSNKINSSRQKIASLHRLSTEFSKRYTGALTLNEKRSHILDFAKQLGASAWQIQGDHRAFSRWFEADAVTERYQKRVAAFEKEITFCLERLGILYVWYEQNTAKTADVRSAWASLHMEDMIIPLLDYEGDTRVRVAAFHCLAALCQTMTREVMAGKIDQSIVQYLFRAALEHQESVWIQTEALLLLEKLSLESLEKALRARFEQVEEGDDLFVRSRAVQLIGKNLRILPNLKKLFPKLASDPSPFVRQRFIRIMECFSDDELKEWLPQLVFQDHVPAVRAAGILKINDFLEKPSLFAFLLQSLKDVFGRETDDFVLRVSLKVTVDGLRQLIEMERADEKALWYETLVESINDLHANSHDFSVKRWASQTREQMWCEYDRRARNLKNYLQPQLANLKPGRRKWFSRKVLQSPNDFTLGRVLSVMGQDDFSYSFKRGMLGIGIRRGDRFGFRLWRMIHEFFRPAPDKRQAFPHTIARIFPEPYQCPSAIMSELTSTKVPGEPLMMPKESGWRPYLPLVDHVYSCMDEIPWMFPQTAIFSSEGITEMRPSKFFLLRWWGKIRLITGFPRFSALRNWEENSQQSPAMYVNALRKLGVQIDFHPYSQEESGSTDPMVSRFFTRDKNHDQL